MRGRARRRLGMAGVGGMVVVVGADTGVSAQVGGDAAVDVAQVGGDADVDARLARSIAFWQTRIDRNPDAYLEWTLLGEALIEKAQYERAIDLYASAEDALRRALDVNPSYVRAQLALGFVLVQRHQFVAAHAVLAPIAAGGDTGLQTRAYLADVYLAIGRYDEARELLRAVETPPSSALMSRRAGLASLDGDVNRAHALMAVAREVSDRSAEPPAIRAFYEFQSGELYLHQGRLTEAERHYRAAMVLAPRDPRPWLGMGEAAAARGHDTKAVAWLTHAEALGHDPEVLALLGDIAAASGDQDAADRYYERVEAVCTANEDSRRMYRTFLAGFYADRGRRLDEAVALALVELDQRQDIATLEMAAWASYKTGDYGRAHTLIGHARQLGTRDAALLYRAGQIARAVGEEEAGRALLAESKTINPHYAPPVTTR